MSIDTGLDAEIVESIVSVGDSITLAGSAGKLLNNNYSAKTIDDRAGVCCLLHIFKNINEIDSDLYAAISVQEEVGLRGALASAFSVQPDFAIAIDVCHAVTPDNSQNAYELGSGAVITAGPNIHPKISDKLLEVANKYNIKTEIDIDSGNTGTDAWAIQTAGLGVPVGLLSIPLKYMHTSVETVNISDIEATALLLENFIKESDRFSEGWLCY